MSDTEMTYTDNPLCPKCGRVMVKKAGELTVVSTADPKKVSKAGPLFTCQDSSCLGLYQGCRR